jgi:peptide/nickel transport system substrate-binding protein
MKHFGLRLLAASSLLCAVAVFGATRPQYGGTLRVMTRVAPTSLDPADTTQSQSTSRRDLEQLLFDTLVTIDRFGRLQPALAVSWKAQPGYRTWQFWVRPNVKFEDGSALTPTSVAASLRAVNSRWAVSALGDSVLIESDTEEPMLAAQLALSTHSIVKRTPDRILGTGPFHVTDWQPGKSLTALANEDYWAGRPFLNAIEISLAKSYRDQALALQLGRTDLIEIAPEQARRSPADQRTAAHSAPVELMALVFARDPGSAEQRKLREAFALSIDRTSIRSVLLQGNGEPSGAILPAWLSGYAFLFATSADLPKARQERAAIRETPTWTLKYDASDPLNRLIAERIALNAKEAGITIQPAVNGTDVRLVTIPLQSMNGAVALSKVAEALGVALPTVKDGGPEALYQAEASILASQRIIPLFHLPANYAVTNSVKNLRVRPDGTCDFGEVWVTPEKP